MIPCSRAWCASSRGRAWPCAARTRWRPICWPATGRIGTLALRAQGRADAGLGFAVRQALGAVDAGQAVVVAHGEVLAIEGAEGTDAMLQRVAGLPGREASGVRRGVLAKGPKPGQELRVDMPAIGPRTVEQAAAAGLAGIVVEDGVVLVLDRAEAVRAADAAGWPSMAWSRRGLRQACRQLRPTGRVIGRCRPSRRDAGDIETGLAAVSALAPLGTGAWRGGRAPLHPGRGGGRGSAGHAERAAKLRQWGVRWRMAGVHGAPRRGRRRRPACSRQSSPRRQRRACGRGRHRHRGRARPYEEAAGLADAMACFWCCARYHEGHRSRTRGARDGGRRHVGQGVSRRGPGAVPVHGGGRAFRRRAGRQLMAVAQRAPPRTHPLPRRRRRADGAAGPGLAVPDEDVAVMGIGAIIARLPTILRRVHSTAAAAVAAEPSALVIIDSPEFTHPIARRVRRRAPQEPIIDYVSPSVWAWRPGRARKMRAYIDHVLALLPFEPAAHERLRRSALQLRRPSAVERLSWIAGLDTAPLARRLGLAPDTPLLVVLPGSRTSEVKRLIGPFGEAVARLAAERPRLEVVMPVVDSRAGADRAAPAGVAEASRACRGRGGQVPLLQAGACGARRLRHRDAGAGRRRHADGGRLQGRCRHGAGAAAHDQGAPRSSSPTWCWARTRSPS